MVLVVVLVGLHAIGWPYAVALFVVMLLVGQLQTAGAILIEEVGFRRYTVRDLMVIAGWSLVELFWYRPLTALWRLWATVLVLAAGGPAGARSRAARRSARAGDRAGTGAAYALNSRAGKSFTALGLLGRAVLVEGLATPAQGTFQHARASERRRSGMSPLSLQSSVYPRLVLATGRSHDGG